MNPMAWAALCVFGLAACAATPEQRALAEQKEHRALQALSVSLAAQCDPQAAALMRRQMDEPALLSDAAYAQEAEAYRQALSKPIFQSCYRLAWENHIHQVRLREAEMRYRYDHMDNMFGWPYYGCPYYRCGRW